MKKTFLTVVLASFSLLLNCQSVLGDWYGQLDIQGIKLRLVLHVQEDAPGGLKATVDSPDQGAEGLPVAEIKFSMPVLEFAMPNLGVTFKGQMQSTGEQIDGVFSQGGQGVPLVLGKKEIGAEQPVRPQEPKGPFPYKEEDVTFINKKANDIHLAGTLTLPEGKGPWPAAILISGSGPQNRNEEILGHKPFLVIADYLMRNGIAVLRFDDRGIGASEGNFKTATSADFATDVAAAVQFLQARKDINDKKIGLIGHSEGGLIAPMVAAQTPQVAFIVMLAGPGENGEKVIIRQSSLIDKAEGKSVEVINGQDMILKECLRIVKSHKNNAETEVALREYLSRIFPTLSEEVRADIGDSTQFIDQELNLLNNDWLRYFITYEPAPTLIKVKCPALVLNGEKDLQVDPVQNIPPIEQALKKGGNTHYKTVVLPGLNHLFQHTETGRPSEYGRLTETFAPEALETMTTWIKSATR